MNKKVDFDRETKTKIKGSLRTKLDSKVEEMAILDQEKNNIKLQSSNFEVAEC